VNQAEQGGGIMRLLSLLIGLSTVGFAGTWSGYLVDSRCYESQQNNVSADTTTVSRDMNVGLQQCRANLKTKRFTIVLNDWSVLKLDTAGNERAAAIVRHNPKRSALYCITVAGSRVKNMIVAGPVVLASIRTQR
jgi:hypothetical protein